MSRRRSWCAVSCCAARIRAVPDDASEEVIRGRLDVYRMQTAVVAEYYAAQGKYASVNGTGTMDEVFGRIADVIGGLE